MTITAEPVYPGEFILSEAVRDRSRDAIVIDASQTIEPGDVLGERVSGNATVTVGTPIGVGNGALGTWTADAGAPAGEYQIEVQAAASNGGSGVVLKPDGTLDGNFTVGTAYNGTINGTVADGATDWAAGTRIPVTVGYAAGSGKFVSVNPAATDGSQYARAIAFQGVTTAAGETAEITGVMRDAEVKGAVLGFGNLTDDQVAAATTQLAGHGIITR